MDSARFRLIRELFDAALELPPEERGAFLVGRCGDESVRAAVGELLASHEGAGEFLARPAMAGADEAAMGSDPFLGHTLGSFRITGVLGAGGMGAVYRAEQSNPRRTVALKIIRGGWSTPGLRQRFAHEAAALGRLRHPGIAQIFEAGSARGPDGRDTPYFAMELVEGPALTAFAARHMLAVRERLALFALICDAAHHAHQKGIVHRDLKPANILVEEAPADTASSAAGAPMGAQPKILDFGIARLTDSDIAVTTIHTDPGQIVGTLAYMSPEQVRGEIEKVDIRSDVYALGVVLYELLTGCLPHAVKGKSVPQAARLIAEEEPTTVGSIDRTLRGDIDTIVQKAMAKEPERRYSSSAELAADVRRHLTDLPIVASPATTGYKLRKFARRNKALVGGVVATFLVLAVGIVGTGIGLVKARAATRLAESRAREAQIEARHAQRTSDFLTSVLSSADPTISRGREVTVREAMDDAAALLDVQLQDEPEVALRSRITLCRTYLSLAQTDKAREQAEKACLLAEQLSGKESLSYARALAARAAVTRIMRKFPDAVDQSRESLVLYSSLLPADDPQVAKAKLAMADALITAWKHEEAASFLREAKAVLDAREDPAAVQCTMMLASILSRRASPSTPENDKVHSEALVMLDEALARARARGPVAELDVAAILNARADMNRRDQNFKQADSDLREAIAVRERIYPALHPKVAMMYAALASNLRLQGRPEEACRVLAPIAEGLRAAGKNTDATYAGIASELALGYGKTRLPELAVEYSREALAVYQKTNNRIMQSVVFADLGRDLLALGRAAEAEEAIHNAIKASGGLERPNTSTAALLRTLAEVQRAQERHKEAAETLARAIEFAPLAGATPQSMLAFMKDRYRALAAAGDEAVANEFLVKVNEFAKQNGLEGILKGGTREEPEGAR